MAFDRPFPYFFFFLTGNNFDEKNFFDRSENDPQNP